MFRAFRVVFLDRCGANSDRQFFVTGSLQLVPGALPLARPSAGPVWPCVETSSWTSWHRSRSSPCGSLGPSTVTGAEPLEPLDRLDGAPESSRLDGAEVFF